MHACRRPLGTKMKIKNGIECVCGAVCGGEEKEDSKLAKMGETSEFFLSERVLYVVRLSRERDKVFTAAHSKNTGLNRNRVRYVSLSLSLFPHSTMMIAMMENCRFHKNVFLYDCHCVCV
jgi:hypothetical protein